MHEIVGQDGEKVNKKGSPPACAKQFDLRILKHQAGPHGINQRNQREMSTMCVLLDHLTLGRYKEAAGVAAARLKAVETANKDGRFGNAQFLELLPVNVEGLTSADDKLVVRNETLLGKGDVSSSSNAWIPSGKGKNENYTWVPKGKGKGDKNKNKEKGDKGNKGKGKKHD